MCYRFLLVALLGVALAGCRTTRESTSSHYYKVRVTDPRGILIADWTARGHVEKVDSGYRFRAVERVAGAPYPQRVTYPHGRWVSASGPNIVVARTGRPLWMDDAMEEELRTFEK